MITVAEAMEKLSKMRQDLPMYIHDEEDGYTAPVTDISVGPARPTPSSEDEEAAVVEWVI